MIPYAIGLDIGITSVGWATVALDATDRPYGIIGMGSRIFDAAEHPKTGQSLAAPRREARTARRRLRRHRHRNERIRYLLTKEKLVSEEQLRALFDGRLSDIYALRVRALEAPITNEEFARILIHIAQRRGFKSNRKGSAAKEDGELLTAVNANRNRMQENHYRTVAEMFLRDSLFQNHRRNKGGEYIATVSRDMVEDEVHQIFAAQRSFGNPAASAVLEASYLEILLGQRSFDDGPGEGSPYSGNQIERMIGKCIFEPDEERAAKACYSFELFSLLEAVNHIRIIGNGRSLPLTDNQRSQVVSLAIKSADLTYAKIRKELAISDDQRFNGVSYGKAEIAEAEKKAKFSHMKAYHQMRKAFERISKGHFAHITIPQRNAIGEVLSKYKTDANIRPALREVGLSEEDIDTAESLSFRKFGHISVKACDKIIPWLEQGMSYSDACAAAGYHFKGHDTQEKAHLLPALDDEAKNTVTSPVALRAISQTIKVVNAIIRERECSPTFINIELAREMAKDFTERYQIKKKQDENHAQNERIMEQIRREYKKESPTGQDLVKFKLYEEQSGICAYSQEPISVEHLFDPNYAEIDHIIPYSISFDDSYNNKVLVFAKENRDKGNRLPLQYLNGKRRDDYIVWVNASVRNYKKRQLLLKESVTEEDEAKFKERNLQDTKTASRFILNYVIDHLEFASFRTARRKHVTSVNGSVTAYLRKRWGITKLRENGDLHHAVDALVVACTTDRLIQQVSRYAQYRETRYQQGEDSRYFVDADTGEIVKEFPYPWPYFRQELDARLGSNPRLAVLDHRFLLYQIANIPVQPLFVSRMPRRKVTGPAHGETIRSGKTDGVLITKTALSKLKLDKNGEIANYYNPQSDRLLYEALKARLQAFDGDGKKAFSEPFHKPKSDGTSGPVVRAIKTCEFNTLNVPVLNGNGFALNECMVRIDVFQVENDGYYFVPIYVSDTRKTELPSKACVAHKPTNEWKEMKVEDFIFSLYPNDLVKVTHKKTLRLNRAKKDANLEASIEVKSIMLYFVSAGVASASIECITHDNSYKIESLGVKTLDALEKYTVDVLGAYHPVKHEIRQRFNRGK